MDNITPVQQMMASCAGALITSLFVTPFDVVKTRLQAQKNPFTKGKCFVYCNGLMDHICVCENGNGKAWYRSRGHFNGTLDAFIKIIRMEGIKSLWSGLPPTLIMAVPATVIYFTAYDQLNTALRPWLQDRGDLAPVIAGGTARAGSATLISPLELIRIKLQSERRSYRELSSVIRLAVHSEGWLSLWRGLGPTLFRDIPFSAMYWYNYEKGKALLCQYNKTTEPTFGMAFISGAVSGSISTTLTMPVDVVKTRRQTEMGEHQAKKSLPQTSFSTFSVMKSIMEESGVKGLFA
ncbi:solute carrier family 25 member 40, partial [Clarias magur]